MSTHYIKEANNKDLLYSIGNYAQYLVTLYMGRNPKKKKDVKLNRFAIPLELTQYCKSAILQFEKKKNGVGLGEREMNVSLVGSENYQAFTVLEGEGGSAGLEKRLELPCCVPPEAQADSC